MRNWKPYIPEVVRQMRADGIEETAVICMAPQNSRTSVGLYRRAVEAEAGGLRIDFTAGWARSSAAGGCVRRAAAAGISKAERGGGRAGAGIVHRAQRADADGGSASRRERAEVRSFGRGQGADPYAEDARRTADLVAARVPEIPRWWFAFQSQGASGGPWLGPSVEETLDRIASEGVTALILQPIGFLCDHVEILFDVDVHFRDYAAKLGIRLERPESLNDSGTLAMAVADLSRLGLARLKGASDRK